MEPDYLFYVWGTGKASQQVIGFVGIESVVGFIDNDINKQNSCWFGKRIISFENYLNASTSIPIIVATYLNSNDIKRQIENADVFCYHELLDNPDNFLDFDLNVLIEMTQDRLIWKGNRCVFYGVNILGILLHKHLRTSGKEVLFVFQDMPDKRKTFFKETYGIREIDLDMLESDDCLNVLLNRISDGNQKELEGIQLNIIQDLDISRGKYYDTSIDFFHNRYISDGTCVIVANGPSLTVEDLDYLSDARVKCFGMNGIFELFAKTRWRPDFYFASDHRMLQLYEDEIKEMDVKYKFLTEHNLSFWERCDDANCYRIHTLFSANDARFSLDVARGFFSAMTVTYMCLQMAFYMGFQKIILLGVDFTGFTGTSENYKHFSENYASKIQDNLKQKNIQLYDPNEIGGWWLKGYKKAQQYAKKMGIEIINATKGGRLEVFKREKLEDALCVGKISYRQ